MNKLIKDINENNNKVNLIAINNLNQHINQIEYKNYIMDSYTQSIIKWIVNNNNHTFPIKKKNWLKTIESTKPLKKTNKLLNPFRTLKLFYSGEQIPFYFHDIRKCILRKIAQQKTQFNKKRLFKFVNELRHIFKIYFNENNNTILQFCIDNKILVLNENGNKLFINKKLIAYIKEQEICKIKGSKRNYSTKLSHNELMNLLNDDMKKMKI